MNLPMRQESLQQCTMDAPLTNSIPSHLNVPKKQCKRVSNTNCEDQENHHLRLTTPTAQQGQQAMPAIDIKQQ
jgi:hypothetical protein